MQRNVVTLELVESVSNLVEASRRRQQGQAEKNNKEQLQ